MLPLVAKAIQELFHQPKDVFFHGKVMDLLFNGVEVDCTSTDFNAKATCSAFEGGDITTVVPSDKEDIYLFSLFGGVCFIMISACLFGPKFLIKFILIAVERYRCRPLENVSWHEKYPRLGQSYTVQ